MSFGELAHGFVSCLLFNAFNLFFNGVLTPGVWVFRAYFSSLCNISSAKIFQHDMWA